MSENSSKTKNITKATEFCMQTVTDVQWQILEDALDRIYIILSSCDDETEAQR